MDYLTFLSELVGHISWPIAAGFICWQLKDAISNLLQRLIKASHGDTTLDFGQDTGINPADRQTNVKIADAVPDGPLGLIAESEGRIYSSLDELKLTTDEEKLKVLAKHHANLQLQSEYVDINQHIFGSQIALLQALNVQPTPVEPEFLESFYSVAKQRHPDEFENYSFESYINFLKTRGLIRSEEGCYFLTVLGRGFLSFLTERGINAHRAY